MPDHGPPRRSIRLDTLHSAAAAKFDNVARFVLLAGSIDLRFTRRKLASYRNILR